MSSGDIRKRSVPGKRKAGLCMTGAAGRGNCQCFVGKISSNPVTLTKSTS